MGILVLQLYITRTGQYFGLRQIQTSQPKSCSHSNEQQTTREVALIVFLFMATRFYICNNNSVPPSTQLLIMAWHYVSPFSALHQFPSWSLSQPHASFTVFDLAVGTADLLTGLCKQWWHRKGICKSGVHTQYTLRQTHPFFTMNSFLSPTFVLRTPSRQSKSDNHKWKQSVHNSMYHF